VWFRILGEPEAIEPIAVSRSVLERARLRKCYGGRRWRKLKGIATVELPDKDIVRAEVHSYEAHGVGRRETKIKRFLE
jgi:hypothetical protein